MKETITAGSDGCQLTPALLMGQYISETKLCLTLDISRRTARRWNHHRTGPPRTRVGAGIYYNVESLRRWLHSQEQPELKRR